jgi:phosphoglycolate phosphatase
MTQSASGDSKIRTRYTSASGTASVHAKEQAEMSFTSVIFDFDYTLADSSTGEIECISYAFDKMNLPPPSAEAIRKTIGLSLPDTLKSLCGHNDESRVTEFRRLFAKRADEVMLDHIVLFNPARPTVDALARRGMTMGIVSTKFRYRIEAFLQREGLKKAFEVIIGGEDVSMHKPDPSGLLVAIERLGRVLGEVAYVGDSTTDAETAKRAGAPFVAVLTGVTAKSEFDIYQPFAVMNDLSHLPAALADQR